MVTVTGTGFVPGATTATFGTTGAPATCVSTTSCTATSPSGSGTVDITVSTAGGTSTTRPRWSAFTYQSTPTGSPR